MGGDSRYYDRDVSTERTGSEGFTRTAQQEMSRSFLSQDLLPFNRRLVSRCKSPLVYPFDVTGSVGNLPVIIFDKMPMIAGQIKEKKYLVDVQISLAAVGDVTWDQGPLQVCNFAPIKELDPWLKKLWREGGGGEPHRESYEFIAYYYARLYDMENAETPICLFTGDESFRERIPGDELRKHFGGNHRDTDAFAVFNELKKKFKGNVFLLHRYYDNYGLNSEIVAQWEEALGEGYVLNLPEDKAVADMTLGIIALASGTRTLEQYIKDIRNRPLEMGGVKYKPQTEGRIKAVTEALEPLEKALKARKTEAKKAQPTKSDPQTKKGSKGTLKI